MSKVVVMKCDWCGKTTEVESHLAREDWRRVFYYREEAEAVEHICDECYERTKLIPAPEQPLVFEDCPRWVYAESHPHACGLHHAGDHGLCGPQPCQVIVRNRREG